MVKSCAAWGCTNREINARSSPTSAERSKDVTFHMFPLKDQQLLKKWVVAVKRENFTPTTNHRLCSNHFSPLDYDDTGFRRKLKRGVVPSIFNFPAHLQKSAVKTRRVLVRTIPASFTTNGTVRTEKSIAQLSKSVCLDHSYFCTDRGLSLRKRRLEEHVKKLQKKLRAFQQRTRRLKKTTRRLKDCLRDAKDKHLLEKGAHEILEDAFGGMSLALFKHMLQRNTNSKNCQQYNQQMRKFAITLHFYSPKAYDYLRPTLCLPHPSTLRKWRSTINVEPGFLSQAMNIAKLYADGCGENRCSLILDEMHLRREVEWSSDRHVYSGHVDFGGGPVSSIEASNALVFMLVSLKASWKTPIAYFLTNHVDSETLSKCITEALLKTAEAGLLVKTVVADGLKANLKAAKLLGCSLSPVDMRCSFQHPHFAGESVWFVCDPPHMLKLMRNLLGDTKILYAMSDDGTFRTISWSYISELHELQKKESLYLANKLSAKHIFYSNVKMKVRIAAQTLSLSVATAIDHLRDDLKLPQFQGSEETCKFIRIVDELFDRLNGKNPHAVGYKAPLANFNKNLWTAFFNKAMHYLLSLYDCKKTPLYLSTRGTPVIGFIVSMKSASGLAEELIGSGFQYLLPYKFSQDHLEMFFGKVRQRGGWNNNPTAEQFRHSMRTLLMQNEVSAPSQGNSFQEEDSPESNETETRPFNFLRQPVIDFHELDMAAERLEKSLHFEDTDWRASCLHYTAGFVCRRLVKKITCKECSSALQSVSEDNGAAFLFLKRKNRGGLVTASRGVIEVIKLAERAFRILMPSPELMITLPYQKNVDLKMQMLVMREMTAEKLESLFPALTDHFSRSNEIGNEESHQTQILKYIISFYLTMKLNKAGKQHQQRTILQGTSSKRMKLNKLILFSGQ